MLAPKATAILLLCASMPGCSQSHNDERGETGTPMHAEIKTIIAEHLGKPLDSIRFESTFADLGADELDLVEITMNVEDSLSLMIPDQSLVDRAGSDSPIDLCQQLTVRDFVEVALENTTINNSTEANENNGDSENAATPGADWQALWKARVALLEEEFGKADDQIFTAMPPIHLGGGADVLTFRDHLDGVVYVTSGLIGSGVQKHADLGEYELLMCVRQENEWSPTLLSQLARYTFDALLSSGDTMDIGPAMPDNSTIAALLFVRYHEFSVNAANAAAILCIGITDTELAHCRAIGYEQVLAKLKESGVFPFTDVQRESVVQ